MRQIALAAGSRCVRGSDTVAGANRVPGDNANLTSRGAVCTPKLRLAQKSATLTAALKQALALVECKTLDHIVVAGEKTTSFAERGLL